MYWTVKTILKRQFQVRKTWIRNVLPNPIRPVPASSLLSLPAAAGEKLPNPSSNKSCPRSKVWYTKVKTSQQRGRDSQIYNGSTDWMGFSPSMYTTMVRYIKRIYRKKSNASLLSSYWFQHSFPPNHIYKPYSLSLSLSLSSLCIPGTVCPYFLTGKRSEPNKRITRRSWPSSNPVSWWLCFTCFVSQKRQSLWLNFL